MSKNSFRLNQKPKNIAKKQKVIVLGSLSALLAACGGDATNTTVKALVKLGDVTGEVTAGDDTITLGDAGNAGTVDLGAGNDTVTGGKQVDFIRAGAGADTINGGAGRDNLLMVGTTSNAGYKQSDLTNPNGLNIDLSKLISLSDLNNNKTSDAATGEVIDGGEDGAILFVYGKVDFTGITLINITIIDIHSEVTVPASLIKTMIDAGILTTIQGDGSTHLTISNDGQAINLDLSNVQMQNIDHITLEAGVILQIDQADLTGTTIIDGIGTIKAVTGLLDLDGLEINPNITIMDASGNIITPSFISSTSVNIAENLTDVGIFSVSNASAVGDVTYALNGVDAALFNINTATGSVSFKTAPDFENPHDVGGNNIYDIKVTATDAHQKSTTQDVSVTVSNVNDLAFTSANTANMPENSTAPFLVVNTNQTVTYSIVGGADMAEFTINTTTGELVHIPVASGSAKMSGEPLSGQDYENIGAKTYDVILRATGISGDVRDQTVTITLENVHENTFNQTRFDVNENTSNPVVNLDVATLFSTFAITGGNDAAKFTINSNTGELSFVNNPNFESPGDANNDNIYNLQVTATDFAFGHDVTTDNISITVTDANDAPIGNVSISGTPTEDQILTASHTITADEDGLGNISFQWQKNGSDINGATATTYTLGQSDVGGTISVNAIYVDAKNNNESVSSDTTTAVVNVNDLPVGNVTITGDAQLGGTLTANNNLTDEDGLGTISYQWQNNGDAIIGATNATYKPDLLDIGGTISVVASYTDDQGKSETVASTATSAINLNPILKLYNLSGRDGYRVDGNEFAGKLGEFASNIGDINGDGYDDIIIGAKTAGDNGRAYVLFGQDGTKPHDFDVSSLDGTNGFSIEGVSDYDWAGNSVSGAGDFNGDGFDDFMISAPLSDINGNSSGSSYLIFGHSGAYASNLNLASLDGSTGFHFGGSAAQDQSGRELSSAGDVNGDGFDDIIMGARETNNNGNGSGSSYVIFGKSSGFSANFDIATLNGSNGFRFDGIANESIANGVAGIGDINGDGFDDIVTVSGAGGTNGGGVSYVIFGKSAGFTASYNAASLNGTNGFSINYEASGDWPLRVSRAGDINGDGIDDMFLGAHGADPNGTNSGSSYVIFGNTSGFSTNFELSSLDGTNGFRLDGVAANNQSGQSVSSAGDINGDGYDDIIVGASDTFVGGYSAGTSYIIYGHKNGFSATINLSSLDGTNGFRIDGPVLTNSGTAVSSAGDLNGDGYDDLLVGAPATDYGPTLSGSAYIIYGGDYFAATINASTSGNDIFTGDGSANILNGGDGSDILNGLANNDILIGGNGIDTLTGGTGADTLTGGGKIDVFITAAGDSTLTIGGTGDAGTIIGFDTITDFQSNTINFMSETYDTIGTASIVADTAGVDGTNSTLSINGEVISKHAISNGIITFDDDNGANAVIQPSNNAEVAALVQYLQLQDFGDAGATVAFDYGADTFIYTQGSDDGVDNGLDILTYLEDVHADSLITTNALGSFDIFIA